MVSDYKEILSDSAKGMKRSAIRELLKLTQKPEIISFAGGLPAKESFPLEQLQEICAEVIATDGAAACQYGSTEGVPELLEILAQRYRDQGLSYVTKENITIITSSQQGLDTVGKIFLNRGDKYICELPSYLGALGAFNSYGGVGVGIPQDEQGMSAVELEKTLAEMKAKGEKPKFIYLIPDFQNPAGMTMPEARRIEILNIAKKHEIMIIEDSPYRELRFSGKPQRMLYDLDNGEGNVITLGTFSKIFMPGFRMGWVLAHPMVIDNFVKAKQSTDLCTSAFLQKITVKFFQKNYFDANVKKIVDMYRGKLEAMLGAFEKYMPEGVTWTRPEGGLFLFLTPYRKDMMLKNYSKSLLKRTWHSYLEPCSLLTVEVKTLCESTSLT